MKLQLSKFWGVSIERAGGAGRTLWLCFVIWHPRGFGLRTLRHHYASLPLNWRAVAALFGVVENDQF